MTYKKERRGCTEHHIVDRVQSNKMTSSFIQFFAVIFLLISVCTGSRSETAKRSIYEEHHDFNQFPGSTVVFTKPVLVHKGGNYYPPVSPAEIAAAISAAKEASEQVMEAQRRVQMAKESVLERQRIASMKESNAAIAAQKAEAAAAVQRQEANAAATSVVLAQRRLAHAKAEVAEHQRTAAAKEAHAAHVIQKSASAAAAEIQKSEHTAAKLAALQRSEATAFKQASAAKEATLSAASAAVAASASHYPAPNNNPWPQMTSFNHWH